MRERGRGGEGKERKKILFFANDWEVHSQLTHILFFNMLTPHGKNSLKFGNVTSKLLENFMNVFLKLNLCQA